ncbi:MAG TPA: hypothetical protein VGD55_03555 [Acidothermaceae bacterium]
MGDHTSRRLAADGTRVGALRRPLRRRHGDRVAHYLGNMPEVGFGSLVPSEVPSLGPFSSPPDEH